MSELPNYERSPLASVLLVLGVAFGGFIIVGPLIGTVLAIPFIKVSLLEFASQLSTPGEYPDLKLPLYIIQGCTTLVGLAILPALYRKYSERRSIGSLFESRLDPMALVVTAVLVIVFTIPNSVIISWNSAIHFPSALEGFEKWAHLQEDRAEELTRVLTTFDNFGEFVIAFVVVAVFAGIGEELVFRGMLQPHLTRLTGNAHAGIWISAILFSAIHVQFFGFIPRVLLGALFGYLYYWSGNLAVPITAHFVNNGFSVIMIYLHQLGYVNIDVDNAEPAPWWMALIGTILTFGLLAYLKKNFRQTRVES